MGEVLAGAKQFLFKGFCVFLATMRGLSVQGMIRVCEQKRGQLLYKSGPVIGLYLTRRSQS